MNALALLFLSLAAILRAAPAAAAGMRYDVSYVSGASLQSAEKRRQAVSAALGPRVARHLKVVPTDGGYGVVYFRRGDAKAAAATAASHSRVLRALGLGQARPVPARRWPGVAPGGRKRRARVEEPKQADAERADEKRQLEGLIAEHVQKMRREGKLSKDERTAWSVYDFTTGETLVEINADIGLQAASLVKPFLALAFMRKVEQGKLAYDAESRRQMTRMIQVSDNAAADWVMRRLGGPAAVQRALREDYGEMLPGVEIKEYIPRGGRTYKNKASARDYSRFLLALWRDELPGSKEIKRLMALPKRDRLHTGVPLPDDMEVYDKTGSTSRLCGDIGVLQATGPDGKQYAYTLIGIIEKSRPARHYFSWLRSRGNIIRGVSYLVYSKLGAAHGFSAAR